MTTQAQKQESMGQGLLPCPFCGDAVQIERWNNEPAVFGVQCTSPACTASVAVEAERRVDAAAKWNTRSSHQPSPQAVGDKKCTVCNGRGWVPHMMGGDSDTKCYECALPPDPEGEIAGYQRPPTKLEAIALKERDGAYSEIAALKAKLAIAVKGLRCIAGYDAALRNLWEAQDWSRGTLREIGEGES